MARIENWIKYFDNSIVGQIYDDKRFENGKLIKTTPIIDLDEKNNRAATKNTVYELGKKWEQ